MAGQADPLRIGADPDLGHRHAESLAAVTGVDTVNNCATENRYFANDSDLRIMERLAPPAIRSARIRVDVGVSVKVLTPVRGPVEVAMKKLPKSICVPGSEGICSCRGRHQDLLRYIHCFRLPRAIIWGRVDNSHWSTLLVVHLAGRAARSGHIRPDPGVRPSRS